MRHPSSAQLQVQGGIGIYWPGSAIIVLLFFYQRKIIPSFSMFGSSRSGVGADGNIQMATHLFPSIEPSTCCCGHFQSPAVCCTQHHGVWGSKSIVRQSRHSSTSPTISGRADNKMSTFFYKSLTQIIVGLL